MISPRDMILTFQNQQNWQKVPFHSVIVAQVATIMLRSMKVFQLRVIFADLPGKLLDWDCKGRCHLPGTRTWKAARHTWDRLPRLPEKTRNPSSTLLQSHAWLRLSCCTPLEEAALSCTGYCTPESVATSASYQISGVGTCISKFWYNALYDPNLACQVLPLKKHFSSIWKPLLTRAQ